jgi:hypothetical protein
MPFLCIGLVACPVRLRSGSERSPACISGRAVVVLRNKSETLTNSCPSPNECIRSRVSPSWLADDDGRRRRVDDPSRARHQATASRQRRRGESHSHLRIRDQCHLICDDHHSQIAMHTPSRSSRSRQEAGGCRQPSAAQPIPGAIPHRNRDMGSGPNDKQGHGANRQGCRREECGETKRPLLFLLLSYSEISTAADNEFAKVASRVDWRLGSGVILQLHQLDSVINLGIGETGRPGNCRWSLCGPTGTAPGMAVRPRDHTGRWHSPDDLLQERVALHPAGTTPPCGCREPWEIHYRACLSKGLGLVTGS